MGDVVAWLALFIGVVSLLVSTFTFWRSAEDRSERQRRQEDDAILEWGRITRRDATTAILTRAAPIPDEWRRQFSAQRKKHLSERRG